jgi:hypothetical protein
MQTGSCGARSAARDAVTTLRCTHLAQGQVVYTHHALHKLQTLRDVRFRQPRGHDSQVCARTKHTSAPDKATHGTRQAAFLKTMLNLSQPHFLTKDAPQRTHTNSDRAMRAIPDVHILGHMYSGTRRWGGGIPN